ncbi:Ribokinase [Paenibacillus solanacearum]|uniref:Ribokinase n=1 Tax=Paenibacillus solanacearum TaxID=2048548 RepID=A0A916K2Z9_9BACL|nr:ribokinase [Paenibacillus solanacearum]CAG7622091.1 Ribokinase [Paenibacillus solanacearum]
MNRPRIAVVGSLNMDLVLSMQAMPRTGETVQAERIHYIPGGKGANQAIGCARLGAQTAMIGAVGADAFGRQLTDQLLQNGVSDHIARLEGTATGTAAIFHTPQDNCIAIVPGANALCSPELVASRRDVIGKAAVLLVQLEIPLETVRQALAMARSAGVKTVLNPAPAMPLPEAVLRMADILTPNETEFAALCQMEHIPDTDLERHMCGWERRYGHRLVVTRGAAGCAYLEDGTLVTVPAPRVNVVDTTGAGDAFNAALGFAIASGWPIARAAAFAIRAASLSVTRFGAQDGMPTMSQVVEH